MMQSDAVPVTSESDVVVDECAHEIPPAADSELLILADSEGGSDTSSDITAPIPSPLSSISSDSLSHDTESSASSSSVDIDLFLGQESLPSPDIYTYKLVGDNIDKNNYKTTPHDL